VSHPRDQVDVVIVGSGPAGSSYARLICDRRPDARVLLVEAGPVVSHSVCDRHSRVWGTHNRYGAGNGLIPPSTACNPTLTSVALAVIGAHQVAGQLHAA
jgi:choline dehydrogenase-like flavoprotein